MKASAHLRYCPSIRCAPCQSSEHDVRNFARRLSCLVLRLWQLRHSQRRLSSVNARSIAAGPSGPRHLDCQPVVDLVGRIAAYLTERALDLVRMLTRCNTIGVQAVEMPARTGLAVSS